MGRMERRYKVSTNVDTCMEYISVAKKIAIKGRARRKNRGQKDSTLGK